MTGRTGYTQVANGDSFDPPADFNDLYAWWDARVDGTVATIAALPSSGNYTGRSMYCQENDAIYRWDATWTLVWQDWTSYTPTVTGITLGSGGTHTAEYRRDGHEVSVRIRTAFGTGGAVTAQPSFTLPVTASDANVEFLNGQGWLKDATGVEYPALIRKTNATTVAPYGHAVVASQVVFQNVTATIPFTWTSNDLIQLNFNYKAA